MSSAPDQGGPTWGGQPPGPQYPPPSAPPQQGSNGVAIAALVVGLLSVPLAIVLVGGVMGIIAVVLGVLGVSKARQMGGTGQGMAITGIVTGVLAIVLTVLLLVLGASLVRFAESEEGQEVLSEIEASISELEAETE